MCGKIIRRDHKINGMNKARQRENDIHITLTGVFAKSIHSLLPFTSRYALCVVTYSTIVLISFIAYGFLKSQMLYYYISLLVTVILFCVHNHQEKVSMKEKKLEIAHDKSEHWIVLLYENVNDVQKLLQDTECPPIQSRDGMLVHNEQD